MALSTRQQNLECQPRKKAKHILQCELRMPPCTLQQKLNGGQESRTQLYLEMLLASDKSKLVGAKEGSAKGAKHADEDEVTGDCLLVILDLALEVLPLQVVLLQLVLHRLETNNSDEQLHRSYLVCLSRPDTTTICEYSKCKNNVNGEQHLRI